LVVRAHLDNVPGMAHRTLLAIALLLLLSSRVGAAAQAAPPDVPIEDFEQPDYRDWVATGTAFGSGPPRGALAGQMAVSGFAGQGLVNTFFEADASTGTLTSPEFTLERNYITFLIGGGGHAGETCVNLLVDGRVARTATGPKDGSEALAPAYWNVGEFRDKKVRIQVVDEATGGWGHVLLDHLVQTDTAPVMENASREVVADKRYLLLPIKNGGPMRRMTVAVMKRPPTREMAIELADGEPDWWAVLDVGAWAGKPLRLQVDVLPNGSKALEQVKLSDELPEANDAAARAGQPVFHFAPPRGWINDPNGMVFYAGEWHLCYQFNPYGTRWQNMSWGHAVSRDLVHWEDLGVALHQQNGVMIFSGSAVVDQGDTTGWGPGGMFDTTLGAAFGGVFGAAAGAGAFDEPVFAALYTGHRVDGSRQTQDLAFSLDRGRTWLKYNGNPVLDIDNPNFRDPKVFWHAPTKKWVMAVVLADERKVQIYGSPDLRKWTHLSDFGPAGAPKKLNWECPDLFELPVEGSEGKERKWVLHVGMGDGAAAGGSGGEYFVGEFDGTTFRSDAPLDSVRWTDYGKDFYASVTWDNVPASDGRRVWLGWMNNWKYANDIPTPTHWRGMMSVPRSLGLRRMAGGELRLIQQPVRELQSLRREHRAVPKTRLEAGTVTIEENAGDAMEIVAEFAPAQDATTFGLKVFVGGGHETVVGYDPAKQELFVDRTRSGNAAFHPDFAGRHAAPLQPGADGKIRIHVLVDRYSVEAFGNEGESAITDLVFPPDGARGIQVFSDRGAVDYSLDTWQLRGASGTGN
jgi:fructan beta-fructosidase